MQLNLSTHAPKPGEQLKNHPNDRPNELVLDDLLHFDPVATPMQDIDPADDSPFRFKTFLKTSGIFFKK